MKRNFLIQLFILSAVCFSSCCKDNPADVPEYIKIAIYDGTPQIEYFIQTLNKEWAGAGHKEELRVVPWDNYDGLPDSDASLLIYDGVFYSALRAKGLLQPISKIPKHYSFDWTYTLADGDRYAEPFLLCSSFLIFDKDNAVFSKAKYVTDVSEEIAVPLYSMCTYYYIGDLAAKGGPDAIKKDLSGDLDADAFAPVKHMKEGWLGGVKFEDSSLSKYNGPARFNEGTEKAIYNFSETTYDLNSKNLSAILLDPFPGAVNRSFNVDYISVRSGISKGAAALCEELISIISSEKFQYEYLDHDGKPLYSLPANKAAFTTLAGKYPLYSTFFQYSSSDMNHPMVLGPDFYEQQSALKEKIRSALR